MRSTMRVSLFRGGVLCLLVLLATGAFAQAGAPASVPGQLLVWAQPGAATADDVAAMAGAAGAKLVRPLLMQDVYLLQVNSATAEPATDADVAKAADSLQATGKFRFVGRNRLFSRADSTPGDPRYREQWHLPLMNMPQAWDIEKGKDTVVACVIDTGCDVTHPDLKDRIVGSHNFADPTKPDDVTDNAPHGTHVAGIIAASTDNGVGVAGVTWQGVKLYIAKCGDAGFAEAPLIDAITYARTNLNKAGTRVVINMSLAGGAASDQPDMTDPFNVAVVAAANEGIISTVAAGNWFDSGNPPTNPANLAPLSPNIICVASVGRGMKHAYYSEARPYTTIAAPGGDQSTSLQDGVLSTVPVASGSYDWFQGTSMAAPACAGVVALLLSADVEPSLVKDILTTSANTLGMQVPNDQFGYGVVDAYAALQNIMSVTVSAPQGTGGKAANQSTIPQPLETMNAPFDITVRQVVPTSLTITLDGQSVPSSDWTITNVKTSIKDAAGTVIPTSYDVTFTKMLAPGKHTIVVSGQGGNPVKTVTDTRTITVQPHLVPAGRAMIAIPYYQTSDQTGQPLLPANVLQYYFGADYRLARYVPAPPPGRYAFQTSFGVTDPLFMPPAGLMPTLGGDPTKPVFPLGVGLWSDVESAKPILTQGTAQTSGSIYIPLVGGAASDANGVTWNMVGAPYPFDVPFNALLVQTPDGTMSVRDAADRGYLLPNLYTYDGAAGYTYRTLPDGVLKAWTGYWVGVTASSNVTLIVPPAGLTRAAPVAGRSVVKGSGWMVQIGATSGALRDTFNFIGESSTSSDGLDRNDVLKPPVMGPYVSLGVDNSGWATRPGRYAQDLRSTAGSKAWNVVVSTDQTNASVTVSWNGSAMLPRGLKLMLRDEATGRSIDMRTTSSYPFNSGATGGDRRFTITASQSSAGLVRVSNLVVRSVGGRAAGTSSIDFNLSGDATYDVRIISTTGRSVATVASRAVAAGDVHVLWSGKDAAGRNVAAGMYMVQIRATGTQGDTVNVVQPFAVIR